MKKSKAKASKRQPISDQLGRIEAIRRENNVLWMAILRIALELAPDLTKEMLRGIHKNDKDISVLLGKLAK